MFSHLVCSDRPSWIKNAQLYTTLRTPPRPGLSSVPLPPLSLPPTAALITQVVVHPPLVSVVSISGVTIPGYHWHSRPQNSYK